MSYSIPKISNSDVANETTFNTPLTAIETALNSLEGRINSITNKEAILVSGVTVSSDTAIGDLVYRDSDSGLFKPAIAELDAVPGSNGASLEAPCARVVGMVVSKAGESATILIGGKYSSKECADSCLGENAAPGTYYLSPATAGKATNNPGASLRQPLITYWGNGVFSLGLFYMAHDNHYHESVVLDKGWKDVEDGDFRYMDIPAGYRYGYNIMADDTLRAMGSLAEDNVSIFVNGVLSTGEFEVTSENIWTNTPYGAGANIVLFTFFPFVYNSPVVRGVVSGSDNITVTSTNGIVTISAGGYVSGDTAPSGTAVSGISGKYINKTPVVSGISGIGGITAVINSSGQAVISSADILNCPVPAMEFNMNGTKRVSDNLFTYIVFPRGVQSSVTMSYIMSSAPGEGSFRFKTWLQATSGSGTLSVSTYFMPIGSSDNPEQDIISTDSTLTTSTVSVATDGSHSMYYETEVGTMADQEGPGVLLATITTSSAPADDIRILNAGFMVVEPSTVVSTSLDNMSGVTCITGTGIAGAPILAGMMLSVDLRSSSTSSPNSGRVTLIPASAASPETIGTLVGIATEDAAIGRTVTYVSSGLCSVPYTLTPGRLLFLGSVAGSISTQPPNLSMGAYIQRIGWAITANKILVDLGDTVEPEDTPSGSDESSSISDSSHSGSESI